jgi:hypothetical protein
MPSATTSDFLHQVSMEFLLKGGTWTPPATLFVALNTTVPTLAGTGGIEVSKVGTGYDRVPIQNAPGSWTGPSGANKEYANAADLVFGVPTANWGTINGASIYDAQTGGNLLYVSYLTAPKTVSNGDGSPKFSAGQLRISRASC